MKHFALSAILLLLIGCNSDAPTASIHQTPNDVSKSATDNAQETAGKHDDAARDSLSSREADVSFTNALRSVQSAHRKFPMIIPTASDAQEAREIHEYITTTAKLPAKCYGKPGRQHNTLTIYEVRDAKSQDEIIRLLTEERNQQSWKPIRVVFMDSEIMNTHEGEDGSVVRIRGKESVLREARIEKEVDPWFIMIFGVGFAIVAGYLGWCGWRRLRAAPSVPDAIQSGGEQ